MVGGGWGQAVWSAYVAGMQEAGFTDDTPVYMASGLLTYGDNTGVILLQMHYSHVTTLSTSGSSHRGIPTLRRLASWRYVKGDSARE